MKVVHWILLVTSILFFGCQNLSSSKPNPTNNVTKPDGPVLAKVGDWYLTPDEFDAMLKSTIEELKVRFGQEITIESLEEKKAILNSIINQEIIAQYARKKGIDKKKDIKLEIESSTRGILFNEISQEIIDEIDVGYKDVQDWYEKNKDHPELKEPEQRRVREIVVSSEQTAKSVLAAIYQGQSFDSLAGGYSEALSKDKGGDLGYVAYNAEEKFPLFWTTVFSLEKGQVSTYFKSPDGKFYILKLEDTIEGRQKTLVELQDDIKEALKIERHQEKLMEIINATKNSLGVEINEDLLR